MVVNRFTGGVKPMSITGRYVNERERVLGMSDAERAFRAQWLKDQILSPNEPRVVPEIYKALHNPIRRFYRWPLDKAAIKLRPVIGETPTLYFRAFAGKAFMAILGVYAMAYYFKYNKTDWTRRGGWRVISSRESCLEGDPGYPKLSDRSKGSDYADRGFKDMKLNL